MIVRCHFEWIFDNFAKICIEKHFQSKSLSIHYICGEALELTV